MHAAELVSYPRVSSVCQLRVKKWARFGNLILHLASAASRPIAGFPEAAHATAYNRAFPRPGAKSSGDDRFYVVAPVEAKQAGLRAAHA